MNLHDQQAEWDRQFAEVNAALSAPVARPRIDWRAPAFALGLSALFFAVWAVLP